VVELGLSYDVHVLAARLDRAAERILQTEQGVSYSRFLALWFVSLGAITQRDLAARLGITEPSVSRMTAALVKAGLLHAGTERGGGNRRRLGLSTQGARLVAECGGLLERRLAVVIAASGVSQARYANDTRRLVAALAAAELQILSGSSDRTGTGSASGPALGRRS
jgi:DNA-binding MarR family transcriptional regulator